MQSVIKYLSLFLYFFLSACVFGPVKELKNQIEDSWVDDDIPINPTPLFDLPNNLSAKVLWNLSLGGKAKLNIESAICKNKLFAANPDGIIYAVDINNGEILWDKNVKQKIIAGISCDDFNIFFVSNDGFVSAISHDGLFLWKSFVGQIYTMPFAFDQHLVVRTIDNKFISLNTLNGSQNWEYISPSPVLTFHSWGKMSFSDGIIFSGLPSGKCLALNLKSGALVWEASYSLPKGTTDIDRANDTTSKPLIIEPFIFVVSSKGYLAMLDKENGQSLWSRTFSSFYGSVQVDESIVSIHNSGSIYSFSQQTGKVEWRNADYINRDIKLPIVKGDYLISGDFEGYLHFIESKSGKSYARLKLSSSPIVNIQIYEKNLLVHNLDNDLFLVSIKNLIEKNISDSNISNQNNDKDNLNIDENNKSAFDELFFWQD